MNESRWQFKVTLIQFECPLDSTTSIQLFFLSLPRIWMSPHYQNVFLSVSIVHKFPFGFLSFNLLPMDPCLLSFNRWRIFKATLEAVVVQCLSWSNFHIYFNECKLRIISPTNPPPPHTKQIKKFVLSQLTFATVKTKELKENNSARITAFNL